MTIKKTKNEGELVISLEGRLDAVTSPELENEIATSIDGINKLVIDTQNLVYVSSAGLRVLLEAHKKMSEQGSMVVTKVCEDIMEIFEITGFSEILTIQ